MPAKPTKKKAPRGPNPAHSLLSSALKPFAKFAKAHQGQHKNYIFCVGPVKLVRLDFERALNIYDRLQRV